MDIAARQLVWNDTIRRAKAAGFVRFDHKGVAVLVMEDAQTETLNAVRSSAGAHAGAPGTGETLPGLASGPVGQGG